VASATREERLRATFISFRQPVGAALHPTTPGLGHTLPLAAAEGHDMSTLIKRTYSTLRDQSPEQFDRLTPA
jgi:hypothetical protein